VTNQIHPALEPFRLGGLDLANRFAVAPMTRVSALADGVPAAQMAEYYARYARGGFGLVITEGTYTDAAYAQGYLHQPGIVTEAHREGWKPVVRGVHEAGAKIVLQLMHAGALSQGNPHRDHTAGPSPIQPKGEMLPDYRGNGPWPVPKELTLRDIREAVDGFVASAVAAQKLGFDGVEVHGANGYLLDQFLTTYTNERTDEYGGPVTNRVRLAAEVVRRIRQAVGSDFVVGIRLSQTKVNDIEYRWPGGSRDGEVIYRTLADAAVSYLHIASEGRNWIETAMLDGGVTITGLARRVTGLPVIANGGMHDAAQAAQVLTDGHADILSLGRGALANPDFPRRLAQGTKLDEFDHAMLHPLADLDSAERWRERRKAGVPVSS
jgi:2,4-dienoyl-CoA reductase-like NADH-dependent reductase (Old Yellow Enzyme family)